jgi:LacI family transcriptional regulator
LCRAKGLDVPHDVAIIGGGNELSLCVAAPPTLTSIDLGYLQIGYKAAELLDRLMDGAPPPDRPQVIASAELIARQSTDSYAVDDVVVARALRFIAEHSHEPINVDDVAATASTTRRSLERRFQKAMSRSIADEITRLRLDRAKRRLTAADEPLKKVASASGFSNPTHFYRAFVRVEGISPTEYRKQRRRDP